MATWARFGTRLLEAFVAQSSVNDDVVHVALHTSSSSAADGYAQGGVVARGPVPLDSLLPTEERDLATSFAETVKEVEAEEAKVLGRLARETEACGDPWAAAVNVFGASPPDAVSVGL